MKYKVYYSDREISSRDVSVSDLPTRDVQCIIQPDSNVGWAMEHTRDFYIWEHDRWQGVDIFGLWDYMTRPGWKKVLFGRTMLTKEYQDLYVRAKADRDFARKNGYLPGEVKP